MQKIDEPGRDQLIAFLRLGRDALVDLLPIEELRRYEEKINQIALETLESDLKKSSTADDCNVVQQVLYVGNNWWTTSKGELFYRPLTEESMVKIIEDVEAQPAPTGFLSALMSRKKRKPLCNHERLKITETLRAPSYLAVRRVECEICGWSYKTHVFGEM